MPLNFDVVIKNNGTVAIDAMDTVIFQPTINNQILVSSTTGDTVVFGETMTNIAAGDSATLTRSFSLTIGGNPPSSFNLCAVAVVRGAGWTGVAESNTTNNQDCNMVNYDAGNTHVADYLVTLNTDNSYFHNGIYYVRMDGGFAASGQPVLNVFSITGKKVYETSLEKRANGVRQDVILPNLLEGIYVVQIGDGTKTFLPAKSLFTKTSNFKRKAASF